MDWWANTVAYSVMVGGAWMAFFDDHYRGIGAICLIIGVFAQWYFKDKAHKELVRHNKELEKKDE